MSKTYTMVHNTMLEQLRERGQAADIITDIMERLHDGVGDENQLRFGIWDVDEGTYSAVIGTPDRETILCGENSYGSSTILEALRIVYEEFNDL